MLELNVDCEEKSAADVGLEDELPNVVLSDESYAKAKGMFAMAVANVLGVFDIYGLGVHIRGAQEEIVRLAEDFGLVVRGVDKPISVGYIRR